MGDVRRNDTFNAVAAALLPFCRGSVSPAKMAHAVMDALSARAAVPEGMSVLVDAIEGAMIESLHGEGFDLWAKNRGKFRNRLPENVGAIIVKMRALLAAAPQPAGEAHPDDATDAARFRWLRDHAINTEGRKGSPWCVYGLDLGDCTPTFGAELVAMVDDAMANGIVCSPVPVESLGRDAPEPAPSAPADAEALTDFARAEYERQREYGATDEHAWHAAFEAAARRISAPAAVKDCLTTADVEALIQHHELWVNDARESGHEDAVVFHTTCLDTIRRLSGAQQAGGLEALNETDKDIALAQAVEFAQYVVDHAKGRMVEAAERFLSLPYSREVAGRLAQAQQTAKDGA